ncbi:MAG: cyclopropane-fatty-acyl-phospholipid synthase family protein [Pseudomonadota bacterium]
MNFLPISFIQKRWFAALAKLEFGTLHFTSPEGETTHYRGHQAGPEVRFIMHDWNVLTRLIARGDIGLGEDYIDGKWESDSVEHLIALFLLNLEHLESFAHGSWLNRRVFALYNSFVRRNSRRGSRINIQSHYDVGNDFYRLWLDETMTYSSALYQGATDLATAQRNKYARILDHLGAPPAQILEIGCGWGGFAEQAAARGHRTTGITVSPAQYAFARARLGDTADILLQDYRDTHGAFDAIVSIEMFEAVGEKYWPDYFASIRENLKPGGSAIIQTITVRDENFADYRSVSDFIRHYVFPGGMLPSVARFREEAAKAGLQTREVFSFGQDYAQTLREWLTRFDAARDQVLAMGYSEAFIRNWRFYLSICAAAFSISRTDVVQVELVHAA